MKESIQSTLFKYGLVLISIATLFAVHNTCRAQLLNEPEKGTKKITLLCSDNDLDLYKRIGLHMVSKGFTIENPSSDFFTFNTGPKKASRNDVSYKVNFAVSGSKVIITMLWRVDAVIAHHPESSFQEWEYKQRVNNIGNVIFKDLTAALTGFQCDDSQYSK